MLDDLIRAARQGDPPHEGEVVYLETPFLIAAVMWECVSVTAGDGAPGGEAGCKLEDDLSELSGVTRSK